MQPTFVDPYFDDADTAHLVGSKGGSVSVAIPATSTIVKERYSWAHFVCALLSAICGCVCCSIPALALTLMGYSDHQAGNIRNYRYKKGWAIACTVLAFVVMIAIVIIYSIYVVPIYEKFFVTYVMPMMQQNQAPAYTDDLGAQAMP